MKNSQNEISDLQGFYGYPFQKGDIQFTPLRGKHSSTVVYLYGYKDKQFGVLIVRTKDSKDMYTLNDVLQKEWKFTDFVPVTPSLQDRWLAVVSSLRRQ